MINIESEDKQILIVKDDRIVAAQLKNILTKCGYIPVAVASGLVSTSQFMEGYE